MALNQERRVLVTTRQGSHPRVFTWQIVTRCSFRPPTGRCICGVLSDAQAAKRQGLLPTSIVTDVTGIALTMPRCVTLDFAPPPTR